MRSLPMGLHCRRLPGGARLRDGGWVRWPGEEVPVSMAGEGGVAEGDRSSAVAAGARPLDRRMLTIWTVEEGAWSAVLVVLAAAADVAVRAVGLDLPWPPGLAAVPQLELRGGRGGAGAAPRRDRAGPLGDPLLPGAVRGHQPGADRADGRPGAAAGPHRGRSERRHHPR